MTTPTHPHAPLPLGELHALLPTLFAPWVAELGLQLRHAEGHTLTLALPVTPRLVHAGGVLCGQALMAAADTAIVLAITRELGGFRPLTTVQLQTSFLRPVPADVTELLVLGRVLKLGRQLVFGEIEARLPGGDLAAHATTTCALL